MNQIKLNNKVAVVTGGARGIGKAICQRFADSGARICIWDFDEETAQEVAGELQEASAIHVDLTCLLYTSPSPRDKRQSRMPSSA